LVILCAVVPAKLKVPALAGLKFKVEPAATAILPLIVCPGVPVIPIFTIPVVMVRLSIVTALPPVMEAVPVPANSTLA